MRKNNLIFLVALLCIKILQSHSMNRSFRLIGTSRKTTSTAVVDPRHLKVEVADHDFPNYFYVINGTYQYPMLIMQIRSIKNRENMKII